VAHNVVPELNAEFIEQLGFSTEAEFTELVRESVERQLLFGQRQETRNQLLESITASADWELPEGLVRQQTDNALRRELLEMTQAGFTQMQIRNRENEIRQNALESTRAALKQHFILDKIATAEDIDASEGEIEHELLMMSFQRGEPVRRIRARLVKSGMIENLYAQLRERKTIDFLLEKVSFEDVPHETIALETASSTRFAICGNMAPTLIDDGAEVEDSE
jgi:trigger factor